VQQETDGSAGRNAKNTKTLANAVIKGTEKRKEKGKQ